MHRGDPSLPADPPRRLTVALVGNPNTGKTTLFNALSGMRQRVGNYPGVTVETKKGRLQIAGRMFELIDLPGTYSLAPRSPDEMLAVDVILGQQVGEARPDVVVSIVDASNLERNLYLTTQLLELGVPVVLALNMIDIAEGQGLRIDVDRLSRQLGLPVVAIQANKGRGLEQLRAAIAATALAGAGGRPRPETPAEPTVHGDGALPPCPTFPPAFEQEVEALHQRLGPSVPRFLVRRLLLDVGGHIEKRWTDRQSPNGAAVSRDELAAARQRLAEAGCPVPAVEARTRYGWIRAALAGCVVRPAQRPVSWTDRIDRVLTHPLWGTLVFAAVMFLIFQSIFYWARPLMDLIDAGRTWLTDLVIASWERPGPLRSLVTDGILAGVGSVLIFLPQIMILFLFIAMLEDCGYMARAAFLMDKLMSRCGLSGKSFIPMLSSLACAVPGIMATRVIENRRDRLATVLVAPLMSCSARLPVYVLMIGAFLTEGHPPWVPGLTMFTMYLIGLVTAPVMALLLKRTLLRGETPVFVLEMPLYKWPSLRTVLRRMTDAAWAFVYRAGTIILACMIVVWALLYFPTTDAEGRRYEERIARLERLDPQTPEVAAEVRRLHGEWKARSLLGRVGRAIEPVVRPLGWDWRLGMAALASFPAREVVVGTLGIIYDVGDVDPGEIAETPDVRQTELGQALLAAEWDGQPGRKVFTVPVALSVMVFFALCCQCASTLATIYRETRHWFWPAFTFTYMTLLAYVGAWGVYQVGSWWLGT
ncbi:MAG: ferrous iron transport protein B [Gemmataceae bacterium]|nr:ferrous iron transport protein B [Gemmataceae bacterium]MDW8264608.1 ferrous iron transport protein B [Gemmataceae bacterium]